MKKIQTSLQDAIVVLTLRGQEVPPSYRILRKQKQNFIGELIFFFKTQFLQKMLGKKLSAKLDETKRIKKKKP